MDRFSRAHPGRAQRHQHGVVKQIRGRIDEPSCIFPSENVGTLRRSRMRHLFDWVVPLQCFAEAL